MHGCTNSGKKNTSICSNSLLLYLLSLDDGTLSLTVEYLYVERGSFRLKNDGVHISVKISVTNRKNNGSIVSDGA